MFYSEVKQLTFTPTAPSCRACSGYNISPSPLIKVNKQAANHRYLGNPPSTSPPKEERRVQDDGEGTVLLLNINNSESSGAHQM